MAETTLTEYRPGLEGVVAAESAICHVDPNAGLLYRGYDVHDLASKLDFEPVAHLLIHGELPDDSQLQAFRRDISAALELPAPIVEALKQCRKQMHPMDVLRTGVSMSAGFDDAVDENGHDHNIAKATRLLGIFTAVTTTGWRVQNGKPPVAPDPSLSLAGNFLYMLEGEKPEDWRREALDKLFILYAEHDLNASTFAARVTCSTLADIYAAVVSAIGALKGPLHGGANEQAMAVIDAAAEADDIDAWLQIKLDLKEKIMGFGHRVYKKGDSRVPILRDQARRIAKQTGHEKLIAAAEHLERSMQEKKGLCANADLYAAPIFRMLATPTELNTPIFACSRVAGWCAHVIEQHDNNRLIRPRANYLGPKERNLS